MKEGAVRFLWRNPAALEGFRTGVCLHGHTMYSQECLSFLPRYLHCVPGVSAVVRRYEEAAVDFARAYWTPPLSPASALRLERGQIAGLGIAPLVSLTDHDDIEAGLALQVTEQRDRVPISVEWTVPYRQSIFHLGIHNLPPQEERRWMARMAAHTAAPEEAELPELLRELHALPETLVVLNHPFWLEEGVTRHNHEHALEHLLRQSVGWLHAFELNGTRPWKENAAAMQLARVYHRPIISGGDRHACEPAACINLTNASTFSEFVQEVREGHSTLMFMPQYREPLAIRVMEASWDILRVYPEYPGRERWIDRIFYRDLEGTARTLANVWKGEVPWMLRGATAALELVATTRLRQAVRQLLLRRGEILP